MAAAEWDTLLKHTLYFCEGGMSLDRIASDAARLPPARDMASAFHAHVARDTLEHTSSESSDTETAGKRARE